MFFMVNGSEKMRIYYDDKLDLLYIRFDERPQEVVNKRVADDIVLDIGEGDKIVGIEVLDASRYINLEALLPVHYESNR